MGAMPFGSISVCKLEAADEGRRVRRRWKKEARGEKEGANSASGSHWPACQGQRPQRRPLPSWHPPGVCTSIAPGAALTINILNFLKMQKPYQPTADQRCFSEVSFCIFLIVCEQVELGCGLNGWWQAWHPGQEQPGLPGQEGHDHGASMVPGQERLCLAPACIGAGTPPASAPNIASR